MLRRLPHAGEVMKWHVCKSARVAPNSRASIGVMVDTTATFVGLVLTAVALGGKHVHPALSSVLVEHVLLGSWSQLDGDAISAVVFVEGAAHLTFDAPAKPGQLVRHG
jgi:hypothetical protein